MKMSLKSVLKATAPATRTEKEGWAEGFKFQAQLTCVNAICFFHTAWVKGRLSAVTSSSLGTVSKFHNLGIIEGELFYVFFFDFLCLPKNNVISGEVLKGLNVVTKHLQKIFSLKYVNIFLSVVQITVFNFAQKLQMFLFIFILNLCSDKKKHFILGIGRNSLFVKLSSSSTLHTLQRLWKLRLLHVFRYLIYLCIESNNILLAYADFSM